MIGLGNGDSGFKYSHFWYQFLRFLGCNKHFEPTTFIFWGYNSYNPYFEALEPSFFMVWRPMVGVI